MSDDLLEILSEMAEIECDVPLASMTTLRIGGPAKYVAYPDSTVALDALVRFLKERGIPYKVIGKGSNLFARMMSLMVSFSVWINSMTTILSATA